MKKYHFIVFILFTATLVSFCLPSHKVTEQRLPLFADTMQTPLALYGSYIYQREACNRCHILKDDSAEITRVSLDGLGKRASNTWHYRLLREPSALIEATKMPAFPGLYVKNISRTQLMRLYLAQDQRHRRGDSLLIDKNLRSEAKLIAADLNSHEISAPNLAVKEIIALIAYLQQIPESPLRRYKDSLWYAAIENRKKAWDNTPLDAHSIVMQYANSTQKDTIAMGEKIFKGICYMCHGKNAEGMVGPNLTDEYWLHGSGSKEILQSIANGMPDRGMQSFKTQFTPEQIGMLVAYIHSVKGTNPANAKMQQGKKEL